jgi:hypothetical protein
MDNDAFHSTYMAWKTQAESLDSKLRPIVQQEVDVNAPDWQEQLANMPHPADESGLREEITALFDEIVDQFETLNVEQRQAIIDLMEKNESLMYSAVIDADLETLEGFRRNMILFVIADQGKDTRDAIVALGHYRELGHKHGYDVDAIFKQLAPIASDHDKYGWGSTRDLLRNR